MRYSPYGGAETFLKRFIAELRERGHTLDVFATDWPPEGGAVVHRVKVWGPSFLRPLIFARNAAKAVAEIKPDCVISLERTSCQDIYRAGDGCHKEWLAKRAKTATPLKRLLIRLNPLHAVILLLERKMFQNARLKRVAANSRMVKDDIVRHYGLPEKRICVIYNGLEKSGDKTDNRLKVRSALGIPAACTLLLFVGSGFERKGLIHAIRAMGLLHGAGDIRLLVIGKGRTGRYIKEAKRLGVESKVIFKGPVAGVASYYQAADIFVLPSIYEPFSNACLEAMDSGLPVVTTAANGISEILVDAGYGATVRDPADSETLARLIAALLDKGVRERASRKVREIAAQYTIERNVNEFLELIEEVSKNA